MDSGETQRGELPVARRWAFGAVVLDERTLELTVAGEPAHLERKPLEVLLYLLRHAGEVVTKDELAENVWPGRILTESVLTRCVSQLRQVLRDEDRNVVRTVHGFGYRLVAEVRVDSSASTPVPAMSLKAGDPVPQRPQWRLAERLGTGGHGEAWLARHDKTGEARVFKFALDADALGSLKREITLYRLLRDTLQQRAAVVPVLEWNVEEPPYFIETEFIEGRDLAAWAARRGGIAALPLELRLELVAQIAEALGAAHSVGVLHKDLKPANVLVEELPDGTPRIRLCDFGSGGVVDTDKLAALGITNLGFTKTADQGTSATPLYVAPEVMAGQPATVAADIYALGVMLYQLVVGDLRQPVAPGWELKVRDPLLRDDIAAAAAGDPAGRLADAAQLAIRLRSLEERRRVCAAEAAARERAERTQRILRELKRTRAFAAAVLVLAIAAITGGVAAYRARNDAMAARATTQAINEFLTDGVLAVDPTAEKPRDASYESLLNRAASQVDIRFGEQPEAAASIHWLLGRRFQEVGHIDEARVQYEKAAALLPMLQDRTAMPSLLALDRLIPIYVERGRLTEAMSLSDKLVHGWKSRYGTSDVSSLLLRARVSRLYAQAGELKRADSELGAILVDLASARPPSVETKAALKDFLGWILSADTSGLSTDKDLVEVAAAYIASIHAGFLTDFAEDYRGAVQEYRKALPVLTRLLGSDSEITALTEMSLALALAELGELEESNDRLTKAEAFFTATLPPRHWLQAVPRLARARLDMAQRRPDKAKVGLKSALSECVEGRCAPRLIEELRYDLARAYDQLGETEEAISAYRQSLAAYELLRGPNHFGALKRRLSLAEALRKTGKTAESESVLGQIEQAALAQLPSRHLTEAEYKRISGLIWLDKHPEKARRALEESLAIVEYRLGSKHLRTISVRADLLLATRQATGGVLSVGK